MTFEDYIAYAGLDWASDHHDLVIVDKTGAVIQTRRFDHTGEQWREIIALLKAHGPLAIAIETTHGVAVQQLADAGLTIYPVVPRAAARYRERKAPSGVKDDQLDAWSLADALRVDGHGWHQLPEGDPMLRELRLLCLDEIELIGQRTALINSLQAALREYFPAALEAFDDWCQPSSWRFILSFPTPQDLVKAKKRGWNKFLHANKLWRQETVEKRHEIFARADQFGADVGTTAAKSLRAISMAKMLLTLEGQIEIYRHRIEQLFADHPKSGLFGSLPAAGAKIAPRLLSLTLPRIEAGIDASVLQCIAGTSPVTIKSGQITKRHIRWHCDKNLRATIHLWSNLSRQKCVWAQAYYQKHRDKGQSHACALRCLGQRWIKILCAMCRANKPYDEALHSRNQAAHGSWVLQLVS